MHSPNHEGALHLADADFEERVLKSDLPVVVDFWAPWCPPCVRLAPVVDALAHEYHGRLLVAKVDITENSQWADHYSINSIPALLFFKNGHLVGSRIGASSAQELRGQFDHLLGANPG